MVVQACVYEDILTRPPFLARLSRQDRRVAGWQQLSALYLAGHIYFFRWIVLGIIYLQGNQLANKEANVSEQVCVSERGKERKRDKTVDVLMSVI